MTDTNLTKDIKNISDIINYVWRASKDSNSSDLCILLEVLLTVVGFYRGSIVWVRPRKEVKIDKYLKES